MKKRIQLQGFLIFVTTIVTIFFMVVRPDVLFVQWREERLDACTDTIGIIIICLGYVIRLIARGYKASQSSNGHKLVVDGIYSHVRNPMYLGSFLIGVGIVVMIFQLWVILIIGLAFIMIYLPQTKKEENYLLKSFGDEYERYKAQTPLFFPRRMFTFLYYLWSQLPYQWASIKSEWPSFVSIVAIVSFLEAWQDTKLFVRHNFVIEFFQSILIFIYVFFIAFVINKMIIRKSLS